MYRCTLSSTSKLDEGVGSQSLTPARLSPGKRPIVSIVQEVEWAPGPVWMSAESVPHRDSLPGLPSP